MIDAKCISTKKTDHWAIRGMAWAGHKFLEASRDDSRWNKAKKIISEKTGSFSFEILKSILMDLMKGAVSGG